MKALSWIAFGSLSVALLFVLRPSSLISWGAFLVLIAPIAVAYMGARRRLALRPFLGRDDQRGDWLSRFGPDSARSVDRFLDAFCEGFEFPMRYKYRLSPDDNTSVYHRSYYFRDEPDGCEHFHFITGLEAAFGVEIGDEDFRDDATLGELLDRIQEKVTSPQH